MSKRKTSDTYNLTRFAYEATEDTLNAAIDSLTAVRDAKFPKTAPAKPKAPRAARSDKGSKRGLPAATTDTEKVNGGDGAVATE